MRLRRTICDGCAHHDNREATDRRILATRDRHRLGAKDSQILREHQVGIDEVMSSLVYVKTRRIKMEGDGGSCIVDGFDFEDNIGSMRPNGHRLASLLVSFARTDLVIFDGSERAGHPTRTRRASS